MKIYEIKRDEEGWPHASVIEAAHKWGLPGVSCDLCGFVGGTVGLEFPALSLPPDLDPSPYLDASPVTPERLSELRGALARAWGENVPLEAGAEFGPLVGKASGRPGDVAWARLCLILLSEAALKRLRHTGVLAAIAVPAQLKWQRKTAPDYFELQILPGLRLARSYSTKWGIPIRCNVCGTEARPELPDRASRLAYAEWENEPALDAGSLPAGDWDLFRIAGLEGTIVGSERFRSAVIELGLTDIAFHEVKVEFP